MLPALALLLSAALHAGGDTTTIAINSPGIRMRLAYHDKACITSLTVRGQQVISHDDGIYTSVTAEGKTYTSRRLMTTPVLEKTGNKVELKEIRYGDNNLTITENWTFTPTARSIRWKIQRRLSRPLTIDASECPAFNFDSIGTWEGAYQGYGGLAWFYLFNEPLCTYGVHTTSSTFWNSRINNGLTVAVEAPGRQVAMKYTRDQDNRLAYGITVSPTVALPRFDSGTHRRRYIRGRTDVWASYTQAPAPTEQCVTLSDFDFNQRYGRGRFVGIDGTKVSAVLNTIARIGVIDSLHFGANSWNTPYGPICLHEQYIAQLGLGIDDPAYLKGYQSCLDFYRDHAIKPDGRVFARWAYSDEDMMPGQNNTYGFYEAQWGILMDANPDLVSNVADLYDLTGDKAWVKRHQSSCERALDWILARDENNNGLVEMMTSDETQHKGSDWIDIIWASYENAFVNAKLYHALVKWAAIEHQLGNSPKASYYGHFAAKLKESFNKPIARGGFWDRENTCYVNWLDKDGSAHGRNMVTPVNFMAIAYGLCDDTTRRNAILKKIETQMRQEHLFFWPLCMSSYAPGEGKASQFPFPQYENGDLFLSWGSIAIKAYADYDPHLALEYVRNVLTQYGKDGLAFQRYGRVRQEGLGDDILSGNSLTIVGLYKSIYGINPRYNRFYLAPHITAAIAGTRLRYNFRGQELKIGLDSNRYMVADNRYTVSASRDFGFYATRNLLRYFDGASEIPSLVVSTGNRLNLAIGAWGQVEKHWTQTAAASPTPLRYEIRQLTPKTTYTLTLDGKAGRKISSDARGNAVFSLPATGQPQRISLRTTLP